MAQGVSINITADASGVDQVTTRLSANLSQAFSGITSQLNQMATASGQASTKMTTGLQALSQATIRLVAPQQDLSKVMLQTGQAAERQLNQFEKLRLQYLKTQESSKNLGGSLGALITSLKGLAAVAGVGFSIQGLVNLTTSIVEAGIANERLLLSLKGALGSAQAAGEAYNFVRGVAHELGLDLVTSVEGFAKLTAATKDTAIQGQATRDLFIAMSQASRVLGLSTAEVSGVMTALTQIIGKNTVSMEELRGQLGERLPAVLRLTAKEMQLTTAQLVEMVSKGQVLATDFIPAVTKAFTEMGKEAPSAAQSATASLNRIGNAWFELKVAIAQSGVLDAVSAIAERIATVLKMTGTMIRTLQGEKLQGGERIAQLQAQMITLAKQAQLAQAEGQKLIATGLDPKIAEANLANIQRQIKARADEILSITSGIKKATEEEAAATEVIAADTARQAHLASLTKVSKAYGDIEDDIKGVVLQLEALRSFDVESLKAMNIDPFGPDFEQRFKERETALLKQHKDLLDKRAGLSKGDAARAVQEAGQSAVEIAKAREEVLANNLKREEAMIQQSADERRRIVDEEAIAALQTQGPSAVAEIDAKRSQARRQIAVDEAQFLQTLRLKALDDQEKLRAATLQADIAAAGKNKSAATKAQEELNALASDTEAERVKIRAQTEDALQNVSKKSADEQIKQARELNKIIQETEQERLQARIDLVDEQIALIEAQVNGEVLTTQQGIAQIQSLEAQRFADIRLLYEQQAQASIDKVNAEVQNEAQAAEQIAKIREGLAHQIQTVELQQQTQQQQHLNELSQGWREWVRDVRGALGNFLVRWAEGQVHSMKDVLNDLKSYFFRIIADMIAYAATHAIIIPIVSAVLGGVGGGGSGGLLSTISQAIGLASTATGLGGAGGTGTGSTSILQLLGLGKMGLELNSFLGPQGVLSGAFDFLTNTVLRGAQSIANFVNAFKFGTDIATESAINLSAAMDAAIPGTPAAGSGLGAGAVTAGTVLGAAGGLAALGGGIYAAINASNAASRAAFAASAAAGAAATATAAIGAGLLGASAATAVGTGWTGVGLIVAAVMAVIGVVLDKVIKPAGPSLSVRAGGGLGIGVQDGKLAVEGGVGSRATRRVGVDREMANTVAQQLDEGITNAVKSIVETINAVALDPAALLGPTQAALQQTLRNLQPINSANAKKMEKDIQEQLRFANLAIVGGLLEPVNLAFDQLRDQGNLKEQLDRLPGTTAGLVAVFKTMNQQLDEIAKVENTDVLRQLSGVRNQVENFGNRISGTAGQIAESIVNQLVDQLVGAGTEGFEQVKLDPGARFNQVGAAVDDLDRSLAEQITDFSEMMQTSVRAITILRNTKDILEQSGLGGGAVGRQIDRLAMATGDAAGRISKEIVTTALTGLASDLDQLLLRPLQLQAVGVNSLFNNGLAALAALQVQWNQLSALGIDTKGLQDQFSRLLGGLLESAFTVLKQSFTTGSFAEFLGVLISIPDDLARLNPELARLKQLGQIFAQVVGPIQQVIETVKGDLQTPAERIATTAALMQDLEGAIADAGNAVDQALPLYAQLAQTIQANAAAQIELTHILAEGMTKAATDAFQGVIDQINREAENQLAVVKGTVEQATAFINQWADDWTQAISDAAEQATDHINTWADDWTTAIRDATEQATEAIQAWGETNTAMVNNWADAANTRASQVARLDELILREQSPAQQQATLEASRERLRARITEGGPGTETALNALIGIDEQLLALAKQSNDLGAQQRLLDEMSRMRDSLAKSLIEMTGTADPLLAQIAISNQQKILLEHIQQTVDTELKRIATWQETETARITDAQTMELERIAVWEQEQSALIAAIQTAELDRLAIWERDETKRITDEQTALVTTWQAKQQAELERIAKWEEETVKAIKIDMVAQLEAVNKRLQELFAGQAAVKVILVPAAAQQGGMVSGTRQGITGLASGVYYAQGGMVPTMLEPGERVFNPPLAGAQEGALVAMNRAFPRFAGGGLTVPGRGSGDTVPMMLPRGSFVMNRRAAGAMGYQGGGMVQGRMGDQSVVINVDLRGSTVRNPADVTRLTTEFREAVRDALREIERRSPKRGS